MPASILSVDDESATTTALELLLRDHGYEVNSAANGTQAEALFARRWFDLVFLDWRLPDADGITLLEGFYEYDTGARHASASVPTAASAPPAPTF